MNTRNHLKAEGLVAQGTAAEDSPRAKRVLIVVESEGAVFDTLTRQHEKGYIPAFAGCFSWGVSPSACAGLWRRLALSSRLRGQEPAIILLSALRLLNRQAPSIRRAAVIKALESWLASPTKDPLALARAPAGGPERLILDWLTMAASLLDEEGYAPVFPAALTFLRGIKIAAPGAEVLVHSTLAEAIALNQWEMAGMGDCFLRIAGAERGDFAAYLRAALRNGYDRGPILVIGSTGASWQAAQSVGARFYPVTPGDENGSWEYLMNGFFPAFLRGETALAERDATDFMRMMLEDIETVVAEV